MAQSKMESSTSSDDRPTTLKPIQIPRRPRVTIERVLVGSIGSFLLVILFPHGVRYFFKHMFAEVVSAIVWIILAGLLTQKLADRITGHASEAKR